MESDLLLLYLKELKHNLSGDLLKQVGSVPLVLGNSGGDLDSLCCAVCFALLLHKLNCNKYFVPVVNISAESWDTHLDCAYVLERLWGLTFEGTEKWRQILFFKEDVLMPENYSQDLLTNCWMPNDLSLVDHNELCVENPLAALIGKSIRRVVDHHKCTYRKRNSDVASWDGGDLFLVEKAGSCASLVAYLWKTSMEKKQVSEKDLSDDVLLLLGVTIMNDTSNLSPDIKNEQWYPIDEEMMEWVLSNLKCPSETFHDILSGLKDVLSNSKRYIEIPFRKLILSDHKIFHYCEMLKVSYCSFRVSIPSIARANRALTLLSELEKFSVANGVCLIILMSFDFTQRVRHLGLYVPENQHLSSTCSQRLVECIESIKELQVSRLSWKNILGSAVPTEVEIQLRSFIVYSQVKNAHSGFISFRGTLSSGSFASLNCEYQLTVSRCLMAEKYNTFQKEARATNTRES